MRLEEDQTLTRKERELRSTAIHEAGHAVASIVLRRKFRYVTIVPDPKRGSAGHVHIAPPSSDASMPVLFDFLVRTLAGHYAEREFGLRPRRDGWEADRHMAIDYAFEFCGSGEEATLWIRLATIRTRRLLAIWRDSIEAVADALIDQKTLDYERTFLITHAAKGCEALVIPR